ncbi:MAG: hypothetical protein ABJF04_13965 [Reichenbachiella sp.]|uniref:hypothetical protein n=1 Tax=Reichenbachiella sp. TaxID=2184521 RepID=UPI003265A85A
MKNTARSVSKSITEKRSSISKVAALNSRVFLASSQCMGERSNYLFAFGAEI